jgi:hypothetical protein
MKSAIAVILIAGAAAGLFAGCVGTLVYIPRKAFVARGALFYSADFSVSTNGVEAYRGKGDAAAIKAAGEAGGQAAVLYLKSKGL